MMHARRSRFAQTALVLIAAGATLATACAGGPTSPSTGGASTTTSSGSDSGSDANSNSQTSPTGAYTLASVDGQNVPCVFDSFSPGPGVTMQMRAMRGTILINADGTYTEEVETQLSGNNLKADIVNVAQTAGFYTVSGTTLILTPAGGQAKPASFANGQIEIVAEAPDLSGNLDRVTFTFRRR